MKNKTVGYMIVGFSLVIGLIIYLFNRALTDIINTSCEHGISCPMWKTLEVHTTISVIVMLLILGLGIFFIFSKETEQKTKRDIEKMKQKLSADEKTVLNKVVEAEGSIFQSDIVEKTEFPKVKVTRILDKLEGMQIIERKRRGMTNVVILKP
jgi:uncharacterized membrane protein